MLGADSKYTIITEDQVNPKLLEDLEQIKEKYLSILDQMWDDNKSEDDHKQQMTDFYDAVGRALINTYTPNELINLYLYVYHKVQENKQKQKARFAGITFERVSKNGETAYTAENKESAIKSKKPYTGYRHKQAILKQALPGDILKDAYKKLDDFQTEAEQSTERSM